MSYIGVDLKVIEGLAGDVARIADVPEERIGWGLVRLWHRTWSDKGTQRTHRELAAAFGGRNIDEVISALVDIGFLEAKGGDLWRVRGANRYLKVKEGLSKGGKAAVKNLRRGPAQEPRLTAGEIPGSKPEPSTQHPAPSTQHPTPNTYDDDVKAAVPESEPPAPSSTPPPLKPKGHRKLFIVDPDVAQPEAPTETWDAIGFWSWAEACRRRTGWPPESEPTGLREWWPKALELAGGVERLAIAYRDGFATDKFWRAATPPCPFSGFMSQTPRYIS